MDIKHFIKRLLSYAFVFFLFVELFARLVLDSTYFDALDTYQVPDVDHATVAVDNLFIGSSRVPATIDVQVWNELAPGTINVVAGRGYSTPGVHIQALEYKLRQYPDFIAGADVYLEFAGISTYSRPFVQDKLMVLRTGPEAAASPHTQMILPYLDFEDLPQVVAQESNRRSVRLEICLKYLFSSYRTMDMVNERFQRKSYLDPRSTDDSSDLVSEGGIRGDRMAETRAFAIKEAEAMMEKTIAEERLSRESLDMSSIAYLEELVRRNGGRLILYEVPLHSVQREVIASESAQADRAVFIDWCTSNNIPIVYHAGFEFNDADLPDMKHLSRSRRADFTQRLFENSSAVKISEANDKSTRNLGGQTAACRD